MIAVGVWAEIQDSTFRDLVDQQEFVYGPYLLVAVGCAVILVSAIGMVGALCETKINKFLLGFVSSIQLNSTIYLHMYNYNYNK